MRFPAHEVTTRHLGSAYPFVAAQGLAASGVLVGRDLLGGQFFYDPFSLYRAGLLTNPNVIVFGQIGRGKSALVKTYLWRQCVFGRRSWVLDPKGEYGELAKAFGVEPVALRPGGSLRLNPLDSDPGSTQEADEVSRRRASLLAALAAASLGRSLLPAERAALEVAVGEVSDDLADVSGRRRIAPTLPAVVDALLRPSPTAAKSLGTDVVGLAADARNVALELRRLVSGDLRGMFDGPTSPEVSLDGPLVVLDLSAVYHSPALGVLMTCAAAWLQAGVSAETSRVAQSVSAETSRPGVSRVSAETSQTGRGTIVVVDEAWAILSNLSVARWLQSAWKLSRAWGVSNVAVLHRVSDLESAGALGSEQRNLAQGLLSDSETRVIYAQPPGEVDRAVAELGLSETEAELLPNLRRGVALWKVGTRSFLVQHALSPHEQSIIDTDLRMATS